MKQVIINNYAFSVNGFHLNYSTQQQSFDLTFDAKATANLLKQAGIIEDFDLDKNGEPVILYTDSMYGRPVSGFCLWCDYVKTFRFIGRHAEILAEHIEGRKSFMKTKAVISNLLQPLTAA
jgi:hypothetical protein